MKVVHIKTNSTVKKIEAKVVSLFKQKAFCLKTFNQLQFTGFIA
ncbi:MULTISPECIES: hypothetical protein [unclassified Mucilaginibacter]|nr:MULTISPECIES: hypothetical protein [unclassified Mucilaginibacter]MEB0249702.1 hypothetical protein [Mucilaginibacter sp. 5B2]MEB0263161.1 hypothetical protein [Mucilaginibacter sp. 10I4]MEB0278131.1 hypothetical protein [Mucilaginibacter sp. 10B2]MEB0301365.1 hypothetical protein [Mucilaginibacter sp. 5C4]WPX23043.1 hypothetical protein RHM67_17325 [Mucilaginibacter sp. 5C4]